MSMRNEIGFFMIYDTKYFIIFEIDWYNQRTRSWW